MPKGLIREYDEVEYLATLSASSGSGSAEDRVGASITSRYLATGTATALSTGVLAAFSSNGTDGASWSWEVPALSFSDSDTGTHKTTGSAGIKLIGVRIFVTHLAEWEVQVDEIEVFKDGASHATHDNSGDGYSATFPYLSPAGLGLFGVPPQLSAETALNPAPALPAFTDEESGGGQETVHDSVSSDIDRITQTAGALEDPFDEITYAPCGKSRAAYTWGDSTAAGGTSLTATATGGWRIKIDGATHTPDVTLPELDWTHDGACGALTEPDLSASDTWTAEVESGESISYSGTEASYASHDSTVWLFPDLSKSVRRMGHDCEALVAAFALPETEKVYTWSCLDQDIGSGTGNEQHASFPSISTGSGTRLALLDNQNVAQAWYANTWAAPHWHFLLWLPDDSVNPTPGTADWTLDGSDVETQDYWGKIRQQWMHHPAITDTDTRTDILTEPLNWGSLGAFLQAQVFSPTKTSWFGIENFKREEPQWEESAAPTGTSASRFTLTNCTAAYGSAITLTPSDTTVTVEFDLTTATVPPYWYPLIAARIKSEWSGSQITSAALYLEGADGARILQAEASSATPALRAAGASTRYAGTWGQDFASDSGETIEGTDSHSAEGQSEAAMDDADRRHQFGELLNGYGAQKLVWVFECDGLTDITLEYPVIYPPDVTSDSAVLVPEAAEFGTVLYADAPGYRWGNSTCWNDGANDHYWPPGKSELGDENRPPTHLDWLSWKRVAYENRAFDDGISTEIGDVWHEDELDSEQDLYDHTHFFLAPFGDHGTACIVNGLTCVPPTCGAPGLAKDSDSALADDTALAQESWHYSSSRRYVVSRRGARLFEGAARKCAADADLSQQGWTINSYTGAIPDDGHTGGWTVRAEGGELATVPPYHGWHVAVGADSLQKVGICRHESGFHYRSVVEDSREIKVGWRGRSSGAPWQDFNSVLTGDMAAIACRTHRNSVRVWVLVGDLQDPKITLHYSDDLGKTFTMATTLHTGGDYGGVALGLRPDGTILAAYIDDGDVSTATIDGAGTASTPATGAWADLDHRGLGAIGFVRTGGRRKWALIGIKSDAVTVVESDTSTGFA